MKHLAKSDFRARIYQNDYDQQRGSNVANCAVKQQPHAYPTTGTMPTRSYLVPANYAQSLRSVYLSILFSIIAFYIMFLLRQHSYLKSYGTCKNVCNAAVIMLHFSHCLANICHVPQIAERCFYVEENKGRFFYNTNGQLLEAQLQEVMHGFSIQILETWVGLLARP